MMKVSVLGSTGSIGTQALQVIDDLKGEKEISVCAVTGNRNIALLEQQIRAYRPRLAAVADEACARALKTAVRDTDTRVLAGAAGVAEAAAAEEADMVLSAIVGFAGLAPTLQAVAAGKDIALANKETLVTAGALFMDAVKEKGVRLLPVDSEHCAIFQCLHAGTRAQVRRILLTASGGPFYGRSRASLKTVTRAEALRHPNWSMGAKITVDSATLMNKGLEIMEARWLFDLPIEQIEVVIHRESIIHSMVEFADKSVIAQLSYPSMKHPIQYALTYPDRLASPDAALSFAALRTLTFGAPDEDAFPCLALAKEAGRAGGIMPTVLNAANEIAVARFLGGEIGFLEIPALVERAMARQRNMIKPTLSDLIETDRAVRQECAAI